MVLSDVENELPVKALRGDITPSVKLQWYNTSRTNPNAEEATGGGYGGRLIDLGKNSRKVASIRTSVSHVGRKIHIFIVLIDHWLVTM